MGWTGAALIRRCGCASLDTRATGGMGTGREARGLSR